MLFLFTKYRSLTLLSFESFHIGFVVREMFTPRQSTVNEATRGIRRSIPMMLCGLLSNLLCSQRRLDRRSRAQFNQSAQRIYICASQQKQSQGNQKALEFAYFPRSVCKFSSIEIHILAHFVLLLNILRLLSGKCQYCFCISCLNGSLHSHTCKQTLCVSATFK